MKKYLLTGLILLLPTVLTVAVVLFLLDFFTAPFVPLVQWILNGFQLNSWMVTALSRIIGLILLCTLIVILGWITRHFLLNKLLEYTHTLMSKIPLVKTIYKISRDIFSALFATEGRQAFKEVVTVPFPHPPHRCVGFSAGEAIDQCQKIEGTRLIAVFTPTAPHPISGFLFLIPEKHLHSANISKEEAVKLLVSCGVVQPSSITIPDLS